MDMQYIRIAARLAYTDSFESIFDPLPDEMIEKYDVVYIRHFICVMQSGDPMPLLSILMKLLKPGGYLQWQEWDISTNTLVVAKTTGAAAAAWHLR
ncbi:hypothetical protein AC579_7192 [Pseudocercospora musae]|uniref:O-methyltransferase domain-containing protein n=1 Tax=Pseudocercospora musae TaxID=113226 RepID=A0A139I459_9PEZI|nr:hypothetical protein AC579_7192 [Pseudocercospora musae]